MIRGFAPIVGDRPRVLVLGSVPSEASLRAGRYYAHPRNAFWPIFERLLAQGASLDYESRCALLTTHGIALWDVLATAERDGSLDSAIVGSSLETNDFGMFLGANPSISAIFCNGSKAHELFRTHVVPTLGAIATPSVTRLPSTSPAHASMDFESKVRAWETVVRTASAT